MKCKFCNGNLRFIYNLNKYKILQCDNCYTSCVESMPGDEELSNYYNGFNFACDVSVKDTLTQPCFYNWFKSFRLKENAKMLDIGGGGGGYSYAFEYFNFGSAYYIDLDPQACEFAKKQMGIKNIFNINIHNWDSNEKFDFIYSRHVIEHLKDPISTIKKICSYLADDGVFVLQFPNGLSLEYSGYSEYLKRDFIKIKNYNKINFLEIYKILFSKKKCHGLDPIRHLWSLSSKGVSTYLDKI